MEKSNHKKDCQPEPETVADQGDGAAKVGGDGCGATTQGRANFFGTVVYRCATEQNAEAASTG
jgi:hypothetical protein